MTQPEPTQRHTVDSITSDVLDALYEQLEAAQQTELARQLATCDKAFASATLRAARNGAALDAANAELGRLRIDVAGADLALNAACRKTDEQRQRAERAEADRDCVDRLRKAALDGRNAAVQRADKAEAALEAFRDRVQAITDEARGGIREQLGYALAVLDAATPDH